MNCLNSNCQNEVTRDYPTCYAHESKIHFTNRQDCRCADCRERRITEARAEYQRLEAVSWEEERRLVYGSPVQAAEAA